MDESHVGSHQQEGYWLEGKIFHFSWIVPLIVDSEDYKDKDYKASNTSFLQEYRQFKYMISPLTVNLIHPDGQTFPRW